jgi:hypothetical protein
MVVNDCGEPILLGKDVTALDGICTNTVPSCPSDPGRARVAVTATEPVYNEVIVVNDCGSPVLFDDGIEAPEGTCTNTVPSSPSGPGRARVAVMGTEPAYNEVIVVNNGGSPIPLALLGVGITIPDGNERPEGSEMPGGRRPLVGREVPGTSTRKVVVAFGSRVFAIVVVLTTEPA